MKAASKDEERAARILANLKGIHKKRSDTRALKSTWTKEENDKLLSVIGKKEHVSWTKVAELMDNGKTPSQCNQHWVFYNT